MKETYAQFIAKSEKDRKAEFEKFQLARGTECVPVIIRADFQELETCKFASKRDASVANILNRIRKITDLQAHEALYLMVQTSKSGSVLVPASTTLGQLWTAYGEGSPDGFLYASVCKENAFGHCK